MKKNVIALLVLVCLLMFNGCGSSGGGGEKSDAADLVVFGTIYTVDSKDSIAAAAAVKDGVFTYVGDADGAEAYMGENTQVIRQEEGMILPGFGDGHAHGSLDGYYKLFELDTYDCTTAEDTLAKIREFVASNPDLNCIKGIGWLNGQFESTGPTAAMLDEISTEVPIVMVSGDHHSIWSNTKAMEMVGYSKDSPDVDGGVILRDAEGNPTGCFRERPAFTPFFDIIPVYTVDQCKRAILAYQQDMVTKGITSYFDPYAIYKEVEDSGNLLKAYTELGKDGEMLIRAYAGYGTNFSIARDPLSALDAVPQIMEDAKSDQFKLETIKIVLDGVVEGHAAYLLEPYADDPDYYGELRWDQDIFNEVCAKANELGLRMHIHAIGDAALKMAVDGLEYAEETTGKEAYRPAITHLQVTQDEDIKRMADMGVIANVDVDWHFKEDGYFYELEVPYLGEERANSEYKNKSFWDAGCTVVYASDYPVGNPCSPLLQIEVGITRCNSYGPEAKPDTQANPSEIVTLNQMIRGLTYNQAYQHDEEDTWGSIEVGKSADLVFLGENLFEIEPAAISEVPVLKTMLKGKVLYEAEDRNPSY